MNESVRKTEIRDQKRRVNEVDYWSGDKVNAEKERREMSRRRENKREVQ